MENLAYATTATNTQINTLTKTNAELTEQLKKALDMIKKLTEDNSKLLVIVEKSVLCAPATPGTPTTTTTTRRKFQGRKLDPKGYYWTHGYKCVKGYNSRTCTTPREGHKCEATRNNIMGCSKANKDCWLSAPHICPTKHY
eukprot:8120434-Ditylum_brightwellii.AAC.1